jgi:hypothetical protein
MDALSYIVELMDIGDRYFEPIHLEDEEDEYEQLMLEDEPELEGWRII